MDVVMRSVKSGFRFFQSFLYAGSIIALLIICCSSTYARQEQDTELLSVITGNNLPTVSNGNDLYHGAINISLPITTAPGRDIDIPISLSYNTSGVKVQEIASWVGLGWNLKAGGVITRELRGYADEGAKGYCGTDNNGEKVSQPVNRDYLMGLAYYKWDAEPDIFYFNFLNYTGRIIIDETGIPHVQPASDLKVIPGVCPGTDGSWTIIDQAGIRYRFGKDESSRETTDNKTYRNGTLIHETSYVSAWYLAEIIMPCSDETVQFTYTATAAQTSENYTQVDYEAQYSSLTGCTASAISPGNDVHKLIVASPKLLREISTMQSRVLFTTGTDLREDFTNGKYLKEISLRDYGSNEVMRFEFNYDYFKTPGCETTLCQRLKLTRVTRPAAQRPIYRFEYNTMLLPDRNAHTIDHWGYYNSNTENSKIPPFTDNEPWWYNCQVGGTYTGANREADSLRSRASILQKVYTEQGGSIEYTYEGHVYLDGSTPQLAGGARIQKVTTCATPGNCRVQRFYYKDTPAATASSGRLFGKPKYNYRMLRSLYSLIYDWITTEGPMVYSVSLPQITDLDGYSVSYGSVCVTDPNGGYIINRFTTKAQRNDQLPEQVQYYVEGLDIGVNATLSPTGDMPYAEPVSFFWERGLLTDREYYNAASQLVKKEKLIYDFNLPEIKRIASYRSVCLYWKSNRSLYNLGKSYTVIKPFVLKQRTETIYDQRYPGNEAYKMVSIVDYSYAPVYPAGQATGKNYLPRKTEQSLPSGEKIVTEVKYLEDYELTSNRDDPSAVSFTALRSKSVNPVIEQIQYRQVGTNKYLMSGSINLYKEYPIGNGKPLPYKVFKVRPAVSAPMGNWSWSTVEHVWMGDFVFDVFSYNQAAYKLTQTNDNYDAFGNLLSSADESGISKTFTYGYNNALVTSETTNPGALQHQKNLAHKPLVGITVSTDENGITTSNTYNSINDPLLVRDHNDQIVARYQHFTPADLQMPSASLTTWGCKQINTLVPFSGPISLLYGTTQYAWDFGDGQTLTTTSGSISHSYAYAGFYTVRVTRTNPEYFGESTSVLSISVGIPVTGVEICANGITYYDICGINPPSSGSCIIPYQTAGSENKAAGLIINNVPGGITPPTLYASVTGGPGESYQWSYSTGSYWSGFGSNSSSVSAPPGYGGGTEGTWQVRCTVTDACGNQATSQILYLTAYRSGSCGDVPLEKRN